MKITDRAGNSFKAFLILASGLIVTHKAFAAGNCTTVLRDTATINAIDAVTQQFNIHLFSLQVNASTKIVDAAGNSISFDQLVSGEDVAVRYCSDTSPFTAISVAQLALPPGTPPPVGILDLNVPSGTESQPVSRIFGESARDHFGYPDGSIAYGDINGDGYDDFVVTAPGIKGIGDNFAAGEAYLFYGSPGLPGQLINISLNSIGASGETWITAT